jgi:hypothetical protein
VIAAGWAAALEAVALRLQAAGVPFLLGGSGLLHALGADVEVRDVDLVLQPGDREAARAAVAEWWRAETTEPTELFRSPWKARLDVDGVEVELIGGLAWFDGERVVEMPFEAAGRWRCGAADVPLAPPQAWLELYGRYRPERAALLASLIRH